MPARNVYLHRGSLTEILVALIARAGTIHDNYFSIISNDHSRYYALVDDAFLESNHTHPEDNHMRLLLRINDAELAAIHDVFAGLQSDLFQLDKQQPT